MLTLRCTTSLLPLVVVVVAANLEANICPKTHKQPTISGWFLFSWFVVLLAIKKYLAFASAAGGYSSCLAADAIARVAEELVPHFGARYTYLCSILARVPMSPATTNHQALKGSFPLVSLQKGACERARWFFDVNIFARRVQVEGKTRVKVELLPLLMLPSLALLLPPWSLSMLLPLLAVAAETAASQALDWQAIY